MNVKNCFSKFFASGIGFVNIEPGSDTTIHALTLTNFYKMKLLNYESL